MGNQYSKRSRQSRFTIRSPVSSHSQRNNKFEKDEQADLKEKRFQDRRLADGGRKTGTQ